MRTHSKESIKWVFEDIKGIISEKGHLSRCYGCEPTYCYKLTFSFFSSFHTGGSLTRGTQQVLDFDFQRRLVDLDTEYLIRWLQDWRRRRRRGRRSRNQQITGHLITSWLPLRFLKFHFQRFEIFEDVDKVWFSEVSKNDCQSASIHLFCNHSKSKCFWWCRCDK